jgi:hypothetical protein
MIKPSNWKPFNAIGKYRGYRFIYGPPVDIAPPDLVENASFQEKLNRAVPRCLVIEDLIGLGEGFVIVSNSEYYLLKDPTAESR